MHQILVISLIVACIGAQTYEQSFLQDLTQNEFGKTILQTIQLELQNNGSIDHILELLNEMKTSINNEQDVEREKSRQHTQFCDDKYDEILFVLDHSALLLAKDQQALPLFLEEQKNKQRQMLDKQDVLVRNNNKIQQLTDERHITRGEYEVRRDELTALIGTLQEARKIISKLSTKKYNALEGTWSFLEIAQPVFVQLKKHQDKFLNSNQNRKGYAVMLDMLLEVAQEPGIQANQQGVVKVQEAIDELIQSVYDLQHQELITDDVREKDYLNQRERIQMQNRILDATIAQLHAKVLVIDQTILELNNDISANSDLSRLKTQQKNDWEKTCVDYHNGYVSATKIRTQESDIITEVIQILQRNYNDLIAMLQTLHD